MYQALQRINLTSAAAVLERIVRLHSAVVLQSTFPKFGTLGLVLTEFKEDARTTVLIAYSRCRLSAVQHFQHDHSIGIRAGWARQVFFFFFLNPRLLSWRGHRPYR